MQIRAEEISQIIRKEIEGFEQKVAVMETGTVLEAGDGIARVYGLEAAMAGELLDFGHNVVGDGRHCNWTVLSALQTFARLYPCFCRRSVNQRAGY